MPRKFSGLIKALAASPLILQRSRTQIGLNQPLAPVVFVTPLLLHVGRTNQNAGFGILIKQRMNFGHLLQESVQPLEFALLDS